MMTSNFTKRLEEFLSSELNDYGLTYSWVYCPDNNAVEVNIFSDRGEYYNSSVYFKNNEEEDILLIEMGEDSWYKTAEYESTVKYFWMKIAPDVFR